MSGRLTTMPALTSEDDFQYCKFSIAVDQSKRRGADTVETDTFTCLAIDDNASAVNFLYSKGGQITFVGLSKKSARKSIFRIFFYGGSFFMDFYICIIPKKIIFIL